MAPRKSARRQSEKVPGSRGTSVPPQSAAILSSVGTVGISEGAPSQTAQAPPASGQPRRRSTSEAFSKAEEEQEPPAKHQRPTAGEPVAEPAPEVPTAATARPVKQPVDRSTRLRPGQARAGPSMQQDGSWVEPPVVACLLSARPSKTARYEARYLAPAPKPRRVALADKSAPKPTVQAGFFDLSCFRIFGAAAAAAEVSVAESAVNDASARETEDAFLRRTTMKLPISDLLKGLLVDDWENITSKNQLVPIPHPKPVNTILDDYLDHERKRREEGSVALELLEETVEGLRQYFNKALGRVLLYRFERIQWHEILRQIRNSDENSAIRCAADAYGAEHLARLLSSLEELVAHTNMNEQSVNRLRIELSIFINWFMANFTTYFVSNYETPSAEYLERAKSF